MSNIGDKTFSGTSKIFDGSLAAALKQCMQHQARMIVQAEADMTDNSTGTPGTAPFTLTNGVNTGALVAYQGTAAAPKTEIDTQLDNVADAVATLVGKLDAIHDAGLPFGAFTDNTGGVDGSGTIGAIASSFTPTNGAGSVDYASFAVIAADIDLKLAQTAYHLNTLLVACGGTKVDLTAAYANGALETSKTFALIDDTTDAGVDGTAADSVAATIADAVFDEWKDNISKLSAAIDSVTADEAAAPDMSFYAVD